MTIIYDICIGQNLGKSITEIRKVIVNFKICKVIVTFEMN